MVGLLIVAGMIILGLVSYLWLLKRQIRRLTAAVPQLPDHARHGGRLFLTFRERNLINLITALNTMVTAFEQENSHSRRAERQLQLAITGLSHDLRTPLTAINGYVQLLQQTTDPVKRQRYLVMIQQGVSKLMTMTDEFYDLTRLEGQQKQLKIVPLALNEQVESEFLSFFDQFDQRHLQVTFPSESVLRRVQGDPELLTRVLQNIIQNALRYAAHQVEISYQVSGQQTCLRVKNDIKSTNQLAIQHVFDQFYTASSSRTNPESSGLGLYLSKQLVTVMGGELTADLTASWFTIQLALPTAHSGQPRRQKSAKTSPKSAS